MGIYIQSKKLPSNWQEFVHEYDISDLSPQTQSIVNLLKSQIDKQGQEALIDRRIALFVQDLIDKAKILKEVDEKWCKLPQDLVEEITKEFGNITDIWEFSKRHDSMYKELKAYELLLEEGFIWKKFKRSKGSSDLNMMKKNKTYNIEVKFKESEDTFLSRIHMCINGMSLLDEYQFIRDKLITVEFKSNQLNNSMRKNIAEEVIDFLKKGESSYDGIYVLIYKGTGHSNRKSNYNSYKKLQLSQTKKKDDVCNLIKKIFCIKNGHLEKMKNKSTKYANFIGFLSWSHPFSNEINIFEIEQCFKSLDLGFKLYVDIHGVGVDSKLLLISN